MSALATSPTADALPVPSSQRPLPFACRRDLIARQIEFEGESWWVLKDPVGLRYHRLQAPHYRALCLLDGRRSLKDIRDELAKQFPALSLQLNHVQRMITSLYEQGLVVTQRPGQASSMLRKQYQARRQNLKQSLTNVLSIRFPGWDPDAALTVLNRWMSWAFHPVTLVLAVALVVSAWTLLLVHIDEFASRLPEFRQFFSWRNLMWLWLTLSATKIIHEFGHGLACKHFGGECHEMGVMVLVFSPTLYCDVTDAWMLRDKWQRIWIAAAGIIVEVVLSAIAIFIWWFTTPGLIHHLCLNVFFVTTVTTVIFNANPLLRYDGYYMLSDWLGIPNLREKATKQLSDVFANVCFGISNHPDPLMPTRGRWWFVAYAIASTFYGWFVMGGVLLFLYVVLKPYQLQSLGVALAAVALCGAIGNIVVLVWRILSAPRSEPMSRFRMSVSAVAVTALVAAALAIPLPWHIEAPFLIEPHSVQHVFNAVAGQQVAFAVQPGQLVQKGDLLVTLSDFEKEDELRQLEAARESQRAEIVTLHALELTAEHALAQQQLESIERRIADLREQLRHFTIVAPIAGETVAAPPIPAPRRGTHRTLANWSGGIAAPENQGCFVASRTHLISVAPDSKMQALLYLDQAHRDDLNLGQQIEIKFEHLADRTFKANVEEIAREQADMAPLMLSTKSGGEIPTVTDASGHEQLTSVAYQARVVLDSNDTQLLKPGMRGTARFLVERRSTANWLWRAFRRTVHFRL